MNNPLVGDINGNSWPVLKQEAIRNFPTDFSEVCKIKKEQIYLTWNCRHTFSASKDSRMGWWLQLTSSTCGTEILFVSFSTNCLRRSSISFRNLIISSSLRIWLTSVTDESVLLFIMPKLGGFTFKTRVSFLIRVVFFACLSSSNRLLSWRTSFSSRRHFSSNWDLSLASEVDWRLVASDIAKYKNRSNSCPH